MPSIYEYIIVICLNFWGYRHLHLWRKSKEAKGLYEYLEVKGVWSWKQLYNAIFVENPLLRNKLKATTTLQANILSWIAWLFCIEVKAHVSSMTVSGQV